MFPNSTKLSLILFSLIYLSCSTPNDPIKETPAPNKPDPSPDIESEYKDVSILAFTIDKTYELDFMRDLENLNQVNLNSELGVPADFHGATANFPLFSFFKKNINSKYQVWDRNVLNGETFKFDEITLNDENEVSTFAVNSVKWLVFFNTLYEDGKRKNIIHIYNKETKSTKRIVLDLDREIIKNEPSATIDGDNLLISSEDFNFNRQLSVLNLDEGQINGSLEFHQNFRATAVKNKLYVFYIDDSYTIYKEDDLSIVKSGAAKFTNFNEPVGFFQSQLQNNLLLTDIFYSQPSTIEKGPAVLNLDSGKLEKGENHFLFLVQDNMLKDFNKKINITSYKVDLETDLVVVGYSLSDGTGGVLYTDFTGEILKNASVDFPPKAIIIK